MYMYKRKFLRLFILFFILAGGIFVSDLTEVSAANIGQVVSSPESGWRRYGNKSGYFTYQGSWTYGGGQDYYTSNTSSRLKFYFKGSKIRFYSYSWGNHTQNAVMCIDGVEYNFRQKNYDTGKYYVLDLEVKNLPFKVHEVSVYERDTQVLSFSGIDIDSNGYVTSCADTRLSLDKTSLNLEDKKIAKLKANVTTYDISDVLWTTSDDRIVKVDNNGNLYGVGNGSAVITAYIPNTSLKAQCNVTVKNSILKVVADYSEVNVKDVFTVNLAIANVSNIKSLMANISYDESKLEIVEIKPAFNIRTIRCKYGNGKLTMNYTNKDKNVFFEDMDIAASIKFRAIGKGETLINIDDGAVSDGERVVRQLNNNNCGSEFINIR